MASHLVPLLSRFSDVVRADKTASRLALVVLLIASFNAAELAYALGARSLGTLTHALHSAFERSVLLLSLWAIAATASSASSSSSSSSSAALQPESFAYPLESYTQRNEVLAAFTCAVFYLFFAMFMCGESAVHWLSAGAVAIASGGAASASTHATDFAGPVTTHHDHEHLHPVHLHLVRLAISLVGATLFARPGYVMRRAQQSLGCCGAGNSDQFSASSSISDAGFAAAVPTARELHVRALFVHFVCDALRCVLLPVASAMGDWDQQTVEFLVHQALALAFAVLNWDICASTALILLQVCTHFDLCLHGRIHCMFLIVLATLCVRLFSSSRVWHCAHRPRRSTRATRWKRVCASSRRSTACSSIAPRTRGRRCPVSWSALCTCACGRTRTRCSC